MKGTDNKTIHSSQLYATVYLVSVTNLPKTYTLGVTLSVLQMCYCL